MLLNVNILYQKNTNTLQNAKIRSFFEMVKFIFIIGGENDGDEIGEDGGAGGDDGGCHGDDRDND